MDAEPMAPRDANPAAAPWRGESIHIEDVRRGRHLVVESWIADRDTAVALAVHLARVQARRMPRA